MCSVIAAAEFSNLLSTSKKTFQAFLSTEKKTPACVWLLYVCVHVCFTDVPCVCFFSQDIASQKFSMPSPVRTVIAADFDNDNELEVFFNNIAYRGPSANRLFRYTHRNKHTHTHLHTCCTSMIVSFNSSLLMSLIDYSCVLI